MQLLAMPTLLATTTGRALTCCSYITFPLRHNKPAHAGFVGDGILTAAVCGNVFAS